MTSPMQYGRLFLAGDAAHIVPPTGAKGLNLAISDVKVLAEVLTANFTSDNHGLLESYSERCIRRAWRAQDFSTMMTFMLHLDPRSDLFELELQRSRQEFTVGSKAAATALSENYVGIPFDSQIMMPKL